jgi:hypothetical protein
MLFSIHVLGNQPTILECVRCSSSMKWTSLAPAPGIATRMVIAIRGSGSGF